MVLEHPAKVSCLFACTITRTQRKAVGRSNTMQSCRKRLILLPHLGYPVLFCRHQGSKDKESSFLKALVHLCPCKCAEEAKERVSDTTQARTLKRTCTSPQQPGSCQQRGSTKVMTQGQLRHPCLQHSCPRSCKAKKRTQEGKHSTTVRFRIQALQI